jgi:beta-1,2-mannobiose phosphorylase / 1,2-beta-oligomannan phosphorylase
MTIIVRTPKNDIPLLTHRPQTRCVTPKSLIKSSLEQGDQVLFSGKVSRVMPVNPYTHIERLGMLVTPQKIKSGEIQLENPDNVDFDLTHLVSTCNPGIYDAGSAGTYILVRAIVGKNYGHAPAKSYQLLGHMPDGKTLKSLRLIPQLSPSENAVPGAKPVKLTYGIEDLRIVHSKIDQCFYLIGTGYDGENCYVTAFRTKDLASGKYEVIGVIGPNNIDPRTLRQSQNGPNLMNKDCFLHPEAVDGHWLLYQRIIPNMQVAKVTDLKEPMQSGFWEERLKPKNLVQNTVLFSDAGSWQSRLGWGGPPIKTDKGWLHIFHASNVQDDGTIAKNPDGTPGIKTYCAGAMLTDLKDPTKVIARVPIPLMEPETPDEIIGPIGNVIFPQGCRLDGDQLYIYYGAADDKIGLARTSLSELLDYVLQFNANGTPKP